MNWHHFVQSRLGEITGDAARDTDIVDELAQHMASRFDQLLGEGVDEQEALHQLASELQDGTRIRGAIRYADRVRPAAPDPPAARLGFARDVALDLRYAVRTLRRSPGFAAVAVLTVAVGVGVNAIVFTIANAVLFKGFPLVERNDRLLYLTSGPGCCVSYPDFEDWRAQSKSFEDMALVHGLPMALSDGVGFAERIEATEVTAGTFALVGQRPILGRDFTHADEMPGANRVAILRYSLWDGRFGLDPAVIGRTIRLNGIPTTIIGVMPRGFSFPQNQDVWVPLVATPDMRRRDVRNTWFVFARLRDGVTADQARSEVATIGRRLGTAYPTTNQGTNLVPYVEDFEGFFIGSRASATYRIMWVAVLFVLLVACANLANLLLARALTRRREIAVRIALGAQRSRIIRQQLVESLTIAVMGGAVGWAVAQAGIEIYPMIVGGSGISDQTPGTWFNDVLNYSMDYRVFAYLGVIVVGTGLLFGVVPALRLSYLDAASTMKADGSRAVGDGVTGRLARLLVSAEMALAVVLLAGAVVMVDSFVREFRSEPSFRTDDVISARIELPSDRYSTVEGRSAFYDRLSLSLVSVPQLRSLALSTAVPGSNATEGALRAYEWEDALSDEENRPRTAVQRISPAYFDTLGVRLSAGRPFTNGDARPGAHVAIVNERFATRHWGIAGAIGKRVRLVRGTEPEEWLTIVGVTPNLLQNRGRQQADPVVYVSFRGEVSAAWLMMRTTAPLDATVTEVRKELRQMDPNLAMAVGPAPLTEQFSGAYRYRAVTATLFLGFSGVALMLACIGLYAVMAHSVSARTVEIGVRAALGAGTSRIIGLVVAQGMQNVGIGLVIGLAGWSAVGSAVGASVADVSPTDPLNLVLVCTILIVSSAIGCLIPTYRAVRIDPTVALRPH